jgi:ElaB/YqjD/DUF883 family membrane-anchored ribosome-binding protein
MMQNQLQKAGKAADEQVRNLARSIGPRVEQAKGQVNSLRETGKRTVAERPLLALAIAFAVGLSIGVAIGRSRNRR